MNSGEAKQRAVDEDRADGSGAAGVPAGQPAGIDTSVAHPARVYDYWLGGENNFPADREAGERAVRQLPGHLPSGQRYPPRPGRSAAALQRARVHAADAADPVRGVPVLRRPELVPPGVVYGHTWRPDPGDIVPPDGVSAYGGVARKP